MFYQITKSEKEDRNDKIRFWHYSGITMLLKNFCVSVFQTVAVVCFINGLLLLVFLNYQEVNQTQPSNGNFFSLSLRNFMSVEGYDSNTTTSTANVTSLQQELSIAKKQLKIIYYKTHKTASTTVGSILFRLGAQHGVQFLPYPDHYYSFENTPTYEVDITLNHHKPTLEYKEMMAHYKQLVPDGKFLTVLREPSKRYLSSYHYYIQPNNKSLSMHLEDKFSRNSMTRDLGIFTEDALQGFMEVAYDKFTFLMTEKLDETLLLLKNAWGWTLQDLLYVKLNDACAKGFNYQRKPMSCRPQYGELTALELQTIRENNNLDYALYERALNDTKATLALQPPSFWRELEVFKQMQLDLQSLCAKDANQTYPTECAPYYWDDTIYEKKIRAGKGYVYDYPFFSVSFD